MNTATGANFDKLPEVMKTFIEDHKEEIVIALLMVGVDPEAEKHLDVAIKFFRDNSQSSYLEAMEHITKTTGITMAESFVILWFMIDRDLVTFKVDANKLN